MKDKLTRRQTLKILGSGGILLFTGSCTGIRRKIQDKLDYLTEHKFAMENFTGEREDRIPWINREEHWINTTCMMCDSRCGLISRIVNSNLVYIKGNPNHPLNRGGVCALGISALQYLYSPDRLITPLRRKGERGSGVWEKMGIRKALYTLDSVLNRVAGSTNSVVFISDEHNTARSIAMKYFLKIFKSSAILSSNYEKNLRYSIKRLLNVDSKPIYDIEKSDYILSFGYDFLSYADNFMGYQRAYSLFRSNPEGRGRHVQIESRLSLTAGKSDWWVPVNPGTEALLAQGIIYVLIRERLYNFNFTQSFFKDFGSFMTYILKNTELEKVSKKTGVDTSIIVQLAKELANSKRPVCLAGPQLYFSENAEYKLMWIFLLNFLLGRFETPGGMLLQDNSVSEEIENTFLGDNSKNINYISYEYVVNKPNFFNDKIVFITENNPYRFANFNNKFIDALKKARLICYWGLYHNDISMFSDIIIPDKTFLERNDISLTSRGLKYPLISSINRVVETNYETYDLSEFLFEKGMNMKNPDLSWDVFLKNVGKEVYKLKRGEIFSSDRRSSFTEMVESLGFWYQSARNAEEFIEKLGREGAWWDPYYNYGEYGSKIGTDDGKINAEDVITKSLYLEEKEEKEYPLSLIPILNSYIGIDGKGADIPGVLELAGLRVNEKWSIWIEINPLTAKKLGIKDGERVRLISKNGYVKAKVKYFEGCMPGCVNLPVGAGTNNFGRWAKNYSGFAYLLFGRERIFESDSPRLYPLKVRIEKL